jgi:lambda family phage holin
MPYKQDFIAALLAAKEQGIGAMLAFIMAYLRGRYNGGAMAKTLIDALMCAMIAWFVRDLLDFIGRVAISLTSPACSLAISVRTRSAA